MRIDATDYSKYDGVWKQYMFPCDASDRHYLHLEWWSDDTPFEGYLEVTPTLWPKPKLRERIKAAIGCLFMRKHYFGGVVLNTETTEDLLTTLAGYLEHEKERVANVQQRETKD